ncbi:MAG: hypothetical protein ACTSVY_02890 [Candidatus Helarchaeota archaeon]
MSGSKKKYMTVREIDGRMGVQSPHEGELKTIEKGFIDFFIKHSEESIKSMARTKLNAKFDEIGFDEDYAITFEYFPEVRIHVLYNNYDDEEDDAISGSELRFLFSGDRVNWVPSEDLLSLLELTFSYLEEQVENKQEVYKMTDKKSDLLEMSIDQRTEPFKHIIINDLDDLAKFIGGSVSQMGEKWSLKKIYFPGIEVTLIYDTREKKLDFIYEGENLEKINNYAKDQFAIFLMNHCIRFISSKYNVKEPGIVKKVFSFNYQKAHF